MRSRFLKLNREMTNADVSFAAYMGLIRRDNRHLAMLGQDRYRDIKTENLLARKTKISC